LQSNHTSGLNIIVSHRFIQVETAFFYKWWTHESEEMRQKFKTLVERGQLEIINGGWSMNDEACVNYLSVIDQFTWGFRLVLTFLPGSLEFHSYFFKKDFE